MNKIIPFNKDIIFDDVIGEIESIALDDTLKFTDAYTIKGELIVRGCHKNSGDKKDFSYPLPVLITVDDKYNTENASIVIDDFYYEIINDNVLRVKIDLMLDDLYYKEEPETRKIEYANVDNDKETEIITSEVKEIKENNEIVNNQKEDKKDYSVYRVYVCKDDDTLDSILKKFKITKEDLEEINDLTNLKVGTKLIIPSTDE